MFNEKIKGAIKSLQLDDAFRKAMASKTDPRQRDLLLRSYNTFSPYFDADRAVIQEALTSEDKLFVARLKRETKGLPLHDFVPTVTSEIMKALKECLTAGVIANDMIYKLTEASDAQMNSMLELLGKIRIISQSSIERVQHLESRIFDALDDRPTISFK